MIREGSGSGGRDELQGVGPHRVSWFVVGSHVAVSVRVTDDDQRREGCVRDHPGGATAVPRRGPGPVRVHREGVEWRGNSRAPRRDARLRHLCCHLHQVFAARNDCPRDVRNTRTFVCGLLRRAALPHGTTVRLDRVGVHAGDHDEQRGGRLGQRQEAV